MERSTLVLWVVSRCLIEPCYQPPLNWQNNLPAAGAVPLAFGLTTNGTLLTSADAEFFARYAFKVTVSLDGIGEVHDRQRFFRRGYGTFERIVENLKALIAIKDRVRLIARVTVTPANSFAREP